MFYSNCEFFAVLKCAKYFLYLKLINSSINFDTFQWLLEYGNRFWMRVCEWFSLSGFQLRVFRRLNPLAKVLTPPFSAGRFNEPIEVEEIPLVGKNLVLDTFSLFGICVNQKSDKHLDKRVNLRGLCDLDLNRLAHVK